MAWRDRRDDTTLDTSSTIVCCLLSLWHATFRVLNNKLHNRRLEYLVLGPHNTTTNAQQQQHTTKKAQQHDAAQHSKTASNGPEEERAAEFHLFALVITHTCIHNFAFVMFVEQRRTCTQSIHTIFVAPWTLFGKDFVE